MLQQVMTEPGKIEFREVETPKPGQGEVLVKIMKIGVCGSDIHVYHGEHPFTKYPVTQGHEVSGEIAELGEGVTGLRVGQKVTIQPQEMCIRDRAICRWSASTTGPSVLTGCAKPFVIRWWWERRS